MAEPRELFIHFAMLLLQAKRGIIIYLEKHSLVQWEEVIYHCSDSPGR